MADAVPSQVRFQKLLNHLDIKQVVCIDDVYANRFDVEEIIAWSSISANQQAMTGILKKAGVDLDMASGTAPAELRTKLGDANLASSIQASVEREKLKKSKNENGAEPEQVSTDRSVLQRLDQLMEGFDNFQGLSPAEWEEQSATITDSLATDRTLFIFDESLGNGFKTGTQYITELSGLPNAGNACFSLLSYTIPEDKQHERTKQFLQQGVTAAAIAKSSLSSETGIGQLQVQLRAAVLSREAQGLLRLCSEAMVKAAKVPDMQLRDLTPLELDEVIFRSSYGEGVHEMDTLIRVYSSALAAALREALRTNAKALKLVSELRAFRGDDEDKASKGSRAWKLQRAEYYEDGSFINTCHMPPEHGDVFCVTTSDDQQGLYVLIGPPCDLMVRNTGERKAGISSVTMCPILSEPPDKNKLEETFKLDYFEEKEGKHAWVYFAQSITLNLWLLDICAVNAKGKGELQIGSACPDWLADGWRIRFSWLNDQAANTATAVLTWPRLRILRRRNKQQEVPPGVVEPGFRVPLNDEKELLVGASNRSGRKKLKLGLERVLRLGPLLSGELMGAYCGYLSRPARPHSLKID